MKKRLLYLSECFTFAGCENVLVNLMSNEALLNRYDVHYAYGYNSDYQRGVEKYIGPAVKTYPLRLFTNDHLLYRVRLGFGNKVVRAAVLLLCAPLRILRMCGVHGAWNAMVLYDLFSRIQPDILHINNGGYPGSLSCRLAVLSAKCAGIEKIIFTVNNMARDQGRAIDPLLDRFVGEQVDFFVTGSHAARQRLAEKRRFDLDKLLVIPNTLRNGITGGQRGGWLRTTFCIDGPAFVIGSAGHLTRRKGYHVLIESLSLLKDLLGNVKVLIFGDGEERSSLQKQIVKYGLDGVVTLPGFKDNLLDYMKDFDLFVLPSIEDEDLPYVILEAMMLGKPVIGTRVAGIPEQIEHGETGLLVDPSNPEALARAIRQILLGTGKLQDMGEAARRKYAANFGYEQTMSRYLELYDSLTNAKKSESESTSSNQTALCKGVQRSGAC
ncbi:MAG TPA: glycosyltransferase family 4 protein [Syntrophorhabdales bacterium]|nr:glycosyltransferase family 4 protein [Syntrophorhabdales bacterium]